MDLQIDLISFVSLPVRAWAGAGGGLPTNGIQIWTYWNLIQSNLFVQDIAIQTIFQKRYRDMIFIWIWIFMTSNSIASASLRYTVATRAFVRPSRSHWLKSMDLVGSFLDLENQFQFRHDRLCRIQDFEIWENWFNSRNEWMKGN